MDKPHLTSSKQTSANLQMFFGGFSSAGIKEENQDAFAAFMPKGSDLFAKGAIAAIADGVSSASQAAQAAQISVTQFINEYYATPETWSTEKSAAKVLTSLNQWLFSQSNNQDLQWLTTFSSLITKSNTGYIFHVGDSRVSKYREGKYEVITRDHNSKAGGSHSVLTRALGADNRLKVDVHKVDLQIGDIFILTCDGVHDFISAKDISTILDRLPKTPSDQDLELTSKIIVETALANGSDDNVSCFLAYVENIPKRKLAELERDLLNKTIPPALKVGMKIDGFQVRKIIHASIRSHLYLVEHETTKDIYVLKAPSENFANDSIYIQGFLREAWVGERVNHANVMGITQSDNKSKFLYHLCEHVKGQTLSEWMHDNPKPSISQVRDIIKQVISALRSFQRLELVHRDLKPDNIMIDEFGQIKLIDYGTVFVASLDENQETIQETVPQGSLNYIAPETLLFMKADYRSDLFSLGVICYEMLTGELPYKPMTRAEVTFDNYEQLKYRSSKHFRYEIPLWLDIALEKATTPDPQSRFQAFSEFEAEISKPNDLAIEAYQRQPLLQRNPVLFWKSTSALLLTLLVISLLT